MAKVYNFWDKIVKVDQGALRLQDGYKRPTVSWKCSNEQITRFVWLALNETVKVGRVSKIYQTGTKDHAYYEIAVISDDVAELRDVIAVLIGSLGLKDESMTEYPQVYVMYPTCDMLKDFMPEAEARKVRQAVFSLHETEGLLMAIYTSNGWQQPVFLCDSIDTYFAAYSGRETSFEKAIEMSKHTKENVTPELYDSMMY